MKRLEEDDSRSGPDRKGENRREFLKKLTYVAPLMLTFQVEDEVSAGEEEEEEFSKRKMRRRKKKRISPVPMMMMKMMMKKRPPPPPPSPSRP